MSTEVRIKVLAFFFLLGFVLILGRTFYWQILKGEKLAIVADEQHFSSLEIPAVRGVIRSRDGFPLVANRQSYWLYADASEMSLEASRAATKLAPLLARINPQLATDSAELEELEKIIHKRLSLRESKWVRIASGLSDQGNEAVRSLGIKGLSFLPQTTRDYPEGSMSAHLLGFVSEDQNGDFSGKFGLEGYYDREIKGEPGKYKQELDALGLPILIGSSIGLEPTVGSDLELTLDRSIQRFVEKHLEEGIKTWGASGGTAVVLEPNTGDILASASLPRYEPVNFYLFPATIYKDPMISDLFEPGSIIKPLVMASALNEGKVKVESRCSDCSGPLTVGEYTIHTFNNTYHPGSNMTEVLVNSDNTGMVYVGRVLGFDKLYSYLKRFGFGSKTGIDLQGEESGSLRSQKQWYPIDQATLTFGQGIALTPIQMARAIAVLANGGRLVTPRIVRAVVTRGERKDLAVKTGNTVISGSAAKLVTEMLVRVSLESPLHFPLSRTPGLSGYKIAAKSGTAQIPIAGHYEKNRTIGSVVGYAPADNPRFVVLVKLDSPTVRPWGSDTAGPIFFHIVDDLLHYYGINPTER